MQAQLSALLIFIVVSFSPASASFDLYPNFEVRGRDYKAIVNSLT